MFVHNIDPVLVRIGAIEIRYYGLIFVLSFILGYFILRYLAQKRKMNLNDEKIQDYLLYIAIGAIVGARLFYCLVYGFGYYISNPFEIFFIWQGGLSFHGGLIGAATAVILFCRKNSVDLRDMADISVIPLALGLAFGRIANFINGELVGRVTEVPWCFQFNGYEGCRHPSQLYESFKNFLIFGILWFVKDRKMKKGALFGTFILLYATFRFIIEFYREADVQLGYFFNLTMGQILCIMMFVFGLCWFYYIYKNKENKK
jgi:phosphatidylglycerol:prolipoprotein diacylglycerol transferase